MEIETIPSPFFNTDVFGQNPFEYKGEVYRFNPTGVNVETVLKLITPGEKSLLIGKRRNFFAFPLNKPVVVGIIDKVFDDPFLGCVKANTPEAETEAAEMNELLVDMNGIEFHRQYYQFMVKEGFEGIVKEVTNGKTPDSLEVHNFLYVFCIHFFARYILGKEKTTWIERVKFLKKVYDDMNAFDYVLLSHELPKDRTHVHFLVWEK
jgi:hypothetical protein